MGEEAQEIGYWLISCSTYMEGHKRNGKIYLKLFYKYINLFCVKFIIGSIKPLNFHK